MKISVTLRKRQRARDFIYYLDIYSNGARHTKWTNVRVFPQDNTKTKNEKKALAENIRNELELQLTSYGTAFVPQSKRSANILKYMEGYLKSYKNKDFRLVQAAVNKYTDFTTKNKSLNKDLTFNNLTEDTFTSFIYYLKYDAGLSGETPLNYWKKFKTIINKANKEGLINSNIYSGVNFTNKTETATTSLKKQILDDAEIQILFKTECGNNEIKKAFLFGCYTGFGYAEMKTLTWKNINNDRIVYNRAKTGIAINNQLSERALSLLGERKEQKEPLFNLRNHINQNIISENAVNKSIKLWIKKAGIDKHITFYCARHSFAIRMLKNGAALITVARAMGHKNTKTTEKYLNFIDELKDDATGQLE